MGNKVVLVEDDKRLASLIGTLLEIENFQMTALYSGKDAVEKIFAIKPDIVVLDLMLPEVNGIDICCQLRPRYTNPILMLTAKDDDFTEVTALKNGVDDYLTKPLRPHVLLARMNVLLRRNFRQAKNPYIVTIHDLTINLMDRQVKKNEYPLELTDAEFDLLVELVQNAGKIVTRDDLFYSLRGIEYNGIDRSVDQRVSTLRRKLNGKDPGGIQYIRTVRGRGYLFPKES